MISSFDRASEQVLTGAASGSNAVGGLISDANCMLKGAAASELNKLIGMSGNKVLNGLSRSVISRMVNDLTPSKLIKKTADIGDKASGLKRYDSLAGNGDNPLFSGVTWERAVQLFREHSSNKLVKKNLFLLEVSSQLTGAGDSSLFHMLATSIDYPTMTISSEKQKIGTANADLVASRDAVEISVTTYDDQAGTLKDWFKCHQSASAPQDGTAGLPSQYAIRIRVVHGIIDSSQSGYEDKGYFRAQTMTHSLSRHEHDLQEVTMQFTQIDTFFGW